MYETSIYQSTKLILNIWAMRSGNNVLILLICLVIASPDNLFG